MNLEHFFTDGVGIVHFTFSMLALFFGSWVLYGTKGTKNHKRMGYFYTIAMLIVVGTSFMLYNLFGSFGIFHVFALIRGLTLLGGMLPMILKKPKSYISMHYNFMYWSVLGLYGALVAETLVRIPKTVVKDTEVLPIFFNLVGVAVFLVMGAGYYFFFKKRKKWAEFDKNSQLP
ncbi:MAG: hypothetical protein HKO09_09350 [Croceitalea sp.]|nr:hypothetical protein [Croceitalea sp.]